MLFNFLTLLIMFLAGTLNSIKNHFGFRQVLTYILVLLFRFIPCDQDRWDFDIEIPSY